MVRVAINGLGRIGRAVFKLILDEPELGLVAVNDLVLAENLAYLLKYDTVYGKYDKPVESSENSLIIDGKEYKVFSEKDLEQLPLLSDLQGERVWKTLLLEQFRFSKVGF